LAHTAVNVNKNSKDSLASICHAINARNLDGVLTLF
jgi:hypothetical protein